MKNIFFVLIAFIGFQVRAQVPALEWEKSFGGTNEQYAESIDQTADGGYIITGRKFSFQGAFLPYFSYYLIKITQNGTLQWEKTFGGNMAIANCVRHTSDGGYIVAGYSTAGNNVVGNHGDKDYWILKLDSQGDISWQKSLGGSGEDVAYSVAQTTDGGYIVGGYSSSFDGDVTGNHGMTDSWIVKLDAIGTIQWQKCIGQEFNELATVVTQDTSGNYIVGAVLPGQPNYDCMLAKLNAAGELLWKKNVGGSQNEFFSSILATSDGGFVMTATTTSNDLDVSGNHGGEGDYWVAKFDPAGNIQWQKCLGGSNYEYVGKISQTTDGGFIVVGNSSSNDFEVSGNHGNVDYCLFKLDASGMIAWQKSLGGSYLDEGRDVQQTADGGYIVVGVTSSNDGDVSMPSDGKDIWVVKLTSENLGTDHFTNNPGLSYFPNPASKEITFSKEVQAVEVYDVSGKLIKNQLVKGVKMDVSDLIAGPYVLKLHTAKGTVTTKFIKE